MTTRTTILCLMVSKDGYLWMKLLENPPPSEHAFPWHPGALHACRALGISGFRRFKRTVSGELPIYEEQ